MKSSHLYVAFLLATLFTIQSFSLKLARNQLPLSIDTGDRNYFGRLGFKQLLELSMDEQSSTQTIANVFRYYIDGRDYFNYVQELYCEANVRGEKYITLQKFFEVTDAQGVHRVDAHRVSEYVRGVFGTVHEDHDDTPIDAYTFTHAAELLFAESVSIITFSYIVQSSRHSKHITVDLEEVQLALVNIFSTFGEDLPEPDCEEIKYLFNQSDVDKDGALNLQEFHVFLSIYLRYYKSGISNNRYSISVMKDQVFEYVWNNEEGLGGHTERSSFLKLAFARFLQMTAYDRIQNQMAHLFFTKFDADGSGAIDRNEFKNLLEFFHAPTAEVEVLFISADTDGSGLIDFAEFIVTLTTLLRKLTADFGYNLLTINGQQATLPETYAVFKEAISFLRLEVISEETFAETFNKVDEDHNVVLDLEEFTKFISEIIGLVRGKIRIEEEAQISAVASLPVNEVDASDISAALEEASEQVSDTVYADSEITTEEDAINQVLDETGADIEEINEAVEQELGATVEEVVEVVENIATEQIIDAVTAIVIEEAETDDCPTVETIEAAIEEVLEDGLVEDIIEEIEETSTEEIIDTVAEAIEETHEGDVEVDASIVIEEEASEQVDDTVYVDEEITTTEDAIDQVLEETGADIEEINEAVEEELGASVEEVVEVVQEIATEQIIDAVTTVVLEEAETDDCPTVEAIEAAIEEVLEDGLVEDIIEEIEETPTEEIIETVAEVVEETHEDIVIEEEASEQVDDTVYADEEHSDEEPIDEVLDTIAEETGYTGEELDEVAEEEFGAPVEDIVEAAQEIATEEVIDAVTSVIVQTTELGGCTTPEDIEAAIEEVIDDGLIDEIIEDIEETPAEQIIETVTEVVEEDHSDEESHEDVIDNLQEETGLTESEIVAAVEGQLDGASVEEVVEAVEQIATEQVIEAVTEAVIEQAESSDCTTVEDIEAAIEEAIDDGTIDEIIEEIETTPTEDIVEAVTEVVAEVHEDIEFEEETGLSTEEIETALEDQLGDVTIEDVAAATEAIATEQVVEAVADAVIEQAESSGCTTVEDVQAVIEEVVESGIVEDIVEEIESVSPAEIVESVEAILEEDVSEQVDDTVYVDVDADVIDTIEEETGLSIDEVSEAVEAHVDGASIEEVIEAAENIATEEVLEAVAAAIIEESNASGECITTESIEAAVEATIEEGIVDEIVEEITETSPEEVVAAVAEAVEEEHHELEGHTEFIQLTGFKNFLSL